jgi:tryptophanyl-tRNA synthetase
MGTKPIVLSASTTSGNLTLGNFIGAVRQWAQMQDTYECYYMVANLHSLTTPQDPKELIQRTRSFFAQYIALGLDPEKNCLFVQSHVPQHAELQWALSCLTPLGNLNRMTQFKDKAENQKSVMAGLLMYPVLMAADILLYNANFVPVGEDQKQHIELCRDIVDFFHNRFGETFTVPQPLIAKLGARIMSLTDPTKKMSKSDENPASFISVLDDPKTIEKKFKRAVTDSGSEVKFSEQNPGIANLMTIYSVLNGKDFQSIENEFQGKLYGHLKIAVAETVIAALKPAQDKYHDLMKHPEHLDALMQKGATKARMRAQKTLSLVYERMGIL